MRTLARMLALPLMLLVVPSAARTAEAEATAEPSLSERADEQTAPPSPPPAESPPAPPAEVPPPPAQPQAESAPPGQWVYTQQYGWVWMPYGDAYTSVPAGGYGVPYAYVYYPVHGWTWIAAPWVWGWGPWPYFGAIGPWHFAWYGYGWWRHPHRWRYAPYWGRASPRGMVGLRPAPGRSGAPQPVSPGVRAPAPRPGGSAGGPAVVAPRGDSGDRGGGGGAAPGRSGGRRAR